MLLPFSKYWLDYRCHDRSGRNRASLLGSVGSDATMAEHVAGPNCRVLAVLRSSSLCGMKRLACVAVVIAIVIGLLLYQWDGMKTTGNVDGEERLCLRGIGFERLFRCYSWCVRLPGRLTPTCSNTLSCMSNSSRAPSRRESGFSTSWPRALLPQARSGLMSTRRCIGQTSLC